MNTRESESLGTRERAVARPNPQSSARQGFDTRAEGKEDRVSRDLQDSIRRTEEAFAEEGKGVFDPKDATRNGQSDEGFALRKPASRQTKHTVQSLIQYAFTKTNKPFSA
jgi:hypothetical protein